VAFSLKCVEEKRHASGYKKGGGERELIEAGERLWVPP
jgi:hypothetical protein